MKHYFKKLSIFLLIFFVSNCAFSQSEKSFPFVTDAQTLSSKITKDLNSDSAKVRAIYEWITANIKYDVKKAQKFDFTIVPVNKILVKRKAICTGYADLFNELCKYAKISSVSIPGYIKNIYVDISDDFYLDRHVWNAVYINNQWKLLVACWDAGYIKYSKRTLWGKIIYVLSSGKYNEYKYKPRFIQKPSKTYFLKLGSIFKIDHLPLNNIWQLNNPVISIEQFKNDSSYYYKNYKVKNDFYKEDKETETKRNIYYSQSDAEKNINNGFAGFNFNKNNHYCLANAYFEMALNRTSDISFVLNDTNNQLAYCDSVIANSDKAIAEYDSNLVMLLQQKTELSVANYAKKSLLFKHNRDLVSSSKKVYSNLSKGVRLMGKSKNVVKSMNNSFKRKHEKAKKDVSFYKRKNAKKYNPTDSLNLLYDGLFLNDSILIQRDSLLLAYMQMDTLFQIIKNATNIYSKKLVSIQEISSQIKKERFELYDDFDYEIRFLKDTLIKYKHLNDRVLYLDSLFFTNIFYSKLKTLKKSYNKQFAFYKKKIQILKKYKSVCVADNGLGEIYNNNLIQMNDEFNLLKKNIDKWKEESVFLKKYCKKQKQLTSKEITSYNNEKITENSFYKIRAGYIKNQFKSLKTAGRIMQKQAILLNKKFTKFREKIAED